MDPNLPSWVSARGAISNFWASRWAMALFLIAAFVLFYHLGTPELFEPDEGRNAEKAREILLTRDWVTPHQDFLPVLDKPIFFYWLVALSYKLFGVSEWTARLPSTLAALGCVLLIYWLVRNAVGIWEALWSALILVTSVEFFLLARIVIFDMSLTFFITLSLCCFYRALHSDDTTKKRLLYLAMYGAMGAATLVKGLVGAVLPGMIIVAFLLLTRKKSELRKMGLITGTILFFLIVVPWYVLVELRNPGYLRYFFWEEHFVRFLTPHFHRSQPWYYFLIVLAVGFLPWTFLLPHAVLTRWKKPLNELTLLLVLWTLLPLLFFSFSHSKLPHYILPVYPPLAILTGVSFASILSGHSSKRRALYLPFCAQALMILVLIAGAVWPVLLPADVGKHFAETAPLLFAAGAATLVALFPFIAYVRMGYLRRQSYFYVFHCIGLLPLFVLIAHIMAAVAVNRSAKPLAENLLAVVRPTDQLVLYDKEYEGLPFYLGSSRPIWIIKSGKEREILGSFYLAEQEPRPMKRYGQVLFTAGEFAEQWKKSSQPLVLLTTAKKLRQIVRPDSTIREEVLKVNDFVLVRRPI